MTKNFEIYFLYNNTNTEKSENEIISEINKDGENCKYLKCCYDNDGRQNRFIGLFNKSYVKEMLENNVFGKEKDFGIISFKNKNNNRIILPEGKTPGGFFILIKDSENIKEDKEEFVKMMKGFVELGWIYPDTYRIKNTETDTNFIILTFKKNENGNYPITFIKKLRALINGKKLKSGQISINWLNSKHKKNSTSTSTNANVNITNLQSVEVAN